MIFDGQPAWWLSHPGVFHFVHGLLPCLSILLIISIGKLYLEALVSALPVATHVTTLVMKGVHMLHSAISPAAAIAPRVWSLNWHHRAEP